MTPEKHEKEANKCFSPKLWNIAIFAPYMRVYLNHILTVLIVAATTQIMAQGTIRDTTLLISQVSVFGAHYIPAGDISEKFGNSTLIGAGYHVKNRKNWIFGIDGGILFRERIKNPGSYLTNMRTNNGEIIAQDGNYAAISMNLRGWIVNASIGRVFSIFGPNSNSGLVVRGGAGYFQHKIHFEARQHEVPQIEDDMRKYYDQLTSGWSLNQFVGYQHLSNSRLTNFFIGIEAIEAFTQNRRGYNIDLGGPDNRQRLDMMFGLKAGWILLIYKRKPQEFYIN